MLVYRVIAEAQRRSGICAFIDAEQAETSASVRPNRNFVISELLREWHGV
jgi:hypothetical protein